MERMVGNMWHRWDEDEFFVFTGNATIKRNGALVMGRGAAKYVRDRWPGVDIKIGAAIEAAPSPYGLLMGRKLGVLQVKKHFADKADPKLIEFSLGKLAQWARTHSTTIVNLNYPGIGAGHLPPKVVEPLLSVLPDNVRVWTYK